MNTSTIGRKHAVPTEALNVNASSLARKLSRRIQGEVRFDKGSRALYATDGSNYRQMHRRCAPKIRRGRILEEQCAASSGEAA